MRDLNTEQAFLYIDPQNSSMYYPTQSSKGPWAPNSMHGRVIAGLIAHEVETKHCNQQELEDMQVARMTFDLFKQAPMAPLSTSSEIIRVGRRIKVIDVCVNSITPQDQLTEVARGRVLMLRKSHTPDNVIWSPPEWDIDVSPPDIHSHGISSLGPSPKIGSPLWETVEIKQPRSVKSSESIPDGPRRAWIRENRNLIDNYPLTQLVRVGLAADIANPYANSGSSGLDFINADISLFLERMPIGEWIGVEGFYHGSCDGVSIGTVALYDQSGRIGQSTVSGLYQSRNTL